MGIKLMVVVVVVTPYVVIGMIEDTKKEIEYLEILIVSTTNILESAKHQLQLLKKAKN